MMKTDPYTEWAQRCLLLPGKSQTGLARALGVHSSAINRLANGNRKLQPGEIERAAAYFGVPPPQVSATVRPSGERWVPVIVSGAAQAGAFREVEDLNQDEPETLYLPPDSKFPNARQFAVDIYGDSMNALRPRPIFEGDRAICVAYEDIAHQLPLIEGMIVLVQRTRDGGHLREWSVKQIELHGGRTEFHPRSTNPSHKPIVVEHDFDADNGTEVQVLGLVRRFVSEMPIA